MRPDGDLSLPDGDELVVTTDDGAALAVTVAGPAEGAEPTDRPAPLLDRVAGRVGSRRPPAARRRPPRRPLRPAGPRGVHRRPRPHLDRPAGRRPRHGARPPRPAGRRARRPLDGRDDGHGLRLQAPRLGAGPGPRRSPSSPRPPTVSPPGAASGSGASSCGVTWSTGCWPSPALGRAFVRGTFGADPRRAHVEATRALFVATPVRRAPILRRGDRRDGPARRPSHGRRARRRRPRHPRHDDRQLAHPGDRRSRRRAPPWSSCPARVTCCRSSGPTRSSPPSSGWPRRPRAGAGHAAGLIPRMAPVPLAASVAM